MRRLRKAIEMVLAALYVGSIFSLGWLDDYYYQTRPRQPDQASGRVFPEDVKGTVGVARVYLTRTEIFPFRYAQYFLIGFFAAAALLGYHWKILGNARENTPKRLY
jgi:hypothetical protein